MIRFTVSLIGTCAAAYALALPAAAADSTAKKNTEKLSFASLDKDSDGKISLNEATEHDGVFVAFKSLDRDKDGMLTRDEFGRYRPAAR